MDINIVDMSEVVHLIKDRKNIKVQEENLVNKIVNHQEVHLQAKDILNQEEVIPQVLQDHEIENNFNLFKDYFFM
jgi:hypothetical protein